MSSLTPRERRQLEELFGMSGGYVLDFSNTSFARFFAEELNLDIYSGAYSDLGSSKANHLRSFWKIETDARVARSISGMLDYCVDTGNPAIENRVLYAQCGAIAARLGQGKPVPDIEAITGDTEDFALVAKAARECFDRNEPEQGLDRLHTFMIKFLRRLCEEHGIPRDRSVPAGGLMGAYVKQLKAEGLLTSKMAEHILNSSTAIFGQFDYVRNNHTLAHDNPILSYDEAILIASNVASTVRFIKAAEAAWKKQDAIEAKRLQREDLHIPF